jgi:type IV pilus assembly protein PilW
MKNRQRAYTLIELMVSLLLGTALIAGFGSLFVHAQKNAKVQRSLSYMMDDGRYILELFGKELRRTGYLNNKFTAAGNEKNVFKKDDKIFGSNINFEIGEYIQGENNVVSEFGDNFAIRYQLKDKDELENNTNSANSACVKNLQLTDKEKEATVNKPNDVNKVTIYFFVKKDPKDPDQWTLYCQAKRDNWIINGTPSTLLSDDEQRLISNVQKLLISYGVDDPDDDDHIANYYTEDPTETETETKNEWKNIVSVRLSVVLLSEDKNLSLSPMTCTVNEVTLTAPDNRLCRVFSTTIALRNRI